MGILRDVGAASRRGAAAPAIETLSREERCVPSSSVTLVGSPAGRTAGAHADAARREKALGDAPHARREFRDDARCGLDDRHPGGNPPVAGEPLERERDFDAGGAPADDGDVDRRCRRRARTALPHAAARRPRDASDAR